MLPEVGVAGQLRLAQARVLVAGLGGLGSPVCTYLAAAGVGRLRIVDGDRVQTSNLNRQVLHQDADLGVTKVESAMAKLSRLNPEMEIEPVHVPIDETSVGDLVSGCDVLVDALDNRRTRLVLNAAAVRASLPLVHGAVQGFEGRVMTILPGLSACLACMDRGGRETTSFPVIGTVPAVMGSIQACEVLKCLLGVGDLLAGRLLAYDGLAQTFTEFKVTRNPACPCCAEPGGGST